VRTYMRTFSSEILMASSLSHSSRRPPWLVIGRRIVLVLVLRSRSTKV